MRQLYKVPHDEDDAAMVELLDLAHEFLQHFCHGNTQNQAILHKHLDLFLNAGVKEAYVGFLNHCYIDKEVEMKEIYSSNYMWDLFELSFLQDMLAILQPHAALPAPGPSSSPVRPSASSKQAWVNYVTDVLMHTMCTFFNSPFSGQSTTAQPIPLKLEAKIQTVFEKAAALSRQTSKRLLASKSSKLEKMASQSYLQNDRSVMEGLQEIVALLEEQLRPLLQAEQSLLVDILYKPHRLFTSPGELTHPDTSGIFISRYMTRPCHENQNYIATHESNGLDIITALILNDAERILYNMNPKQLVGHLPYLVTARPT
ncbi:unnamed protein product [Danaus chrysippus]|uniref:(African queen) hypothetical protein n=1 Tax=Danaus chrysippus TaxID=151541 RepID=A0A8J2W5N3_9NEOP|nr:unnamed protein product [Danaus chrysippus]